MKFDGGLGASGVSAVAAKVRQIAAVGLVLSAIAGFPLPSAAQEYPTSRVSWERFPGTATDIAIGSDGSVWAVGAGNANKVGGGYRIFRTGSANVQWTPVPGVGLRIAVEGSTPWSVGDTGQVSRWDGKAWRPVVAPKAVDIGASAKGVWITAEPKVGENYSIYQWSGKGWTKSSGAAVRVDVDADGNPWVVNARGQVFAYHNKRWLGFQTTEPVSDLSVHTFGEPQVVTKTGSLMRYDSKQKKWEKTADGVTAVAQRGSMFLQLNARQELARAVPSAVTATRAPAASPTVAPPPSGTTAAPTRTTTAPAGSASTTLSTTPLSVTTTTLPTALSVTNPTTTNPPTNLSTMSPLSIMGTLNTDGAPISAPGGGPQLTLVTPVVLPRPMSKGKLVCPIVGGTPARMQAPCEGTAAPLFLADAPGVECPSGGFFDPRKGGECWSCPSGFVRTLHAVDRSDACTKGEELSRATLIRHEICPANTFRDGSNCWSCPSGFSRTWDPVTAERACSQSWSGPFARATKHGAAHSGCPAGSFSDPRNGGECWSCPAGFNRSLAHVTEFNACSKVIHREFKSATFVSRSKCGSVRTAPGYGAPFFDARRGGKCWACPVGHTRNVWAVDSEAQVKGCSRYFIWDTPQYPEPGIYALAQPELLRLALGDPKRLRAYVSKRAKGQPNVEREILAKMVRTPGDSPELKALMFAAILSDKGIPHAAPFQQYIFDRRGYVINEALAMYDSWNGIDAYQMSQATRRSAGTLAGNDPGGMQSGVVGSAPPDILAYAWSSAMPDAAGGATLDAVYTLSGMANAGELGPLTDTAAFFDPIYLAPIFKALDKAVDGMGDWVKNAATWTSQVNRHVAFLGANFALALVQYSVDLYTVISALVAIEDTKKAIDEANATAKKPVNLREMIKTDEGRSQLLLYWALFSSPYSGGAKVGQGALSDADSCKRAVAFAVGHSPCEVVKQHVANSIRAAGYDQNILSQVFK